MAETRGQDPMPQPGAPLTSSVNLHMKICLGFLHREFLVQIKVQEKHVDARLTQKTQLPPFGVGLDELLDLIDVMPRASATRGAWARAEAGLMSGSKPLAEVVSRSAGMGP